MKAIAAVDSNWGIGLKNELLVHIPADQKFFRKMTEGNVVVMGRRTLESFPNGMPLKNRINIVLSSNLSFHPDGCTVVRNTEQLMEELKKYDTDRVFVIGGQKVYSELLPLCDTAYITKIDKAFDADAFFPNLDDDAAWKAVDDGSADDEQTYFDLIYHFLTYKRG